MQSYRKDLLGLKELDTEEIINILDVATEMKKILVQGVKKFRTSKTRVS